MSDDSQKPVIKRLISTSDITTPQTVAVHDRLISTANLNQTQQSNNNKPKK